MSSGETISARQLYAPAFTFEPEFKCRQKLPSLKLLPFSPDYEFTTRINACYDENANGDNFKGFIDYATNGKKDNKHLTQEVLAYGLSNQ